MQAPPAPAPAFLAQPGPGAHLPPGYPPYAPPAGPGYAPYPPAYPGYQPYPPGAPGNHNGYAYPYPYPYPYAWQQPKPKRDGYLFGVAIASFVGSILVLLGGLGSLLILALFSLLPARTSGISPDQLFASIVTFIAFAIIGLVGGSFALYHSVRSLFLRKPSSGFSMPTFWLFVALYAIVIGIGFTLRLQNNFVPSPALVVLLILLAGLFPALAVLALGDRRLRFRKKGAWPTSWRRFTLAIVSGATLGVTIAAVLELVFQVLIARGQSVDPFVCITNPNATGCQDPAIYGLLLITIAVIAPLVEEAVKPLAVIILIGRVRSAAEAFVLGLACGIGFDLLETTGYISSSYHDWLITALIRTGAGLLHGFGAAMVALGWYYLTHRSRRHVLKAAGCWLYAVAQHAIWNGSWGLALLPNPVGSFFDNTLNLTIGSFTLPYYALVNIAEALFMLGFFLYMTEKLRPKEEQGRPINETMSQGAGQQ